MSQEEIILSFEKLSRFTHDMFLAIGCSEAHAAIATRVLVEADLRGIDSHGVARLSGYVRLWEAGRINTSPAIRIVHQTPSTAVVDGDSGLGLVVAQEAMDIAIAKADQAGTGWVSVCNSNHYGIAASHAMKSLAKNMIGISMTNASAIVAPTFSKERMLGTNPICVAIPAGEESPFIADMATTTAANGKLEILQRKKEEAPTGWIQDAHGNSTTDAHALKNGGALLPLGGDREHGSHKGYALGSIVDIFSGVLSGANFGPWVPPFPAYIPMPSYQPGKGIGHFLGAMRTDAFRPSDEFLRDMDQWIRRFREAKPTSEHEKVLIPGDPERESQIQRLREGIPLLPVVFEDLTLLGQKFSVKL